MKKLLQILLLLNVILFLKDNNTKSFEEFITEQNKSLENDIQKPINMLLKSIFDDEKNSNNNKKKLLFKIISDNIKFNYNNNKLTNHNDNKLIFTKESYSEEIDYMIEKFKEASFVKFLQESLNFAERNKIANIKEFFSNYQYILMFKDHEEIINVLELLKKDIENTNG